MAQTKYKLINKKSGEEHLCENVTIDGFEYYVSDGEIKGGFYTDGEDLFEATLNNIPLQPTEDFKKVIATNNPTIDIPKIMDEVEMLGYEFLKERGLKENSIAFSPFIIGYNKSQETHPFSEEDLRFIIKESLYYWTKNACSEKEAIDNILQIWKEQRPKIVYYESD